MKMRHLLIVLLLVSNITLSSGFTFELTAVSVGGAIGGAVGGVGGAVVVVAAAVSYIFYPRTEPDGLLPFDPKRLEADLRDSLFGQHIASKVVLKAVTSFMTDSKPNKPLVLSFHGTTGVGKNHVTKIIARNVYEKGEDSKHVHTYAQLKQWIHGNVSTFPRSMFVFDEMDKMNPSLIDVIKPFLDYNALVDGVSFHDAIFIFLSNAGGSVINEVAREFLKEDKDREDIRMNSKDLETKISKDIFNEKGGFQHSSIIGHHLIDHYVPFLPLELKHVRQCVLAEMLHLKMRKDDDLADKVAREMPFFPEEEKIFSVKGCKSVRQKLALFADE